MVYFLDDIKNRFDFFLRSRITFSRKNYKEIPYNMDEIELSNKQTECYENLKEKYDLSVFSDLNTRNFFENLYFLNVFDKYCSKKSRSKISILDIGSKNWSYAKSEFVFFESFSENFTLNGIELDPYRLCSNLYNRYEIAKFYTKNLPNTNYIPGDFLEHNQKYDFILWILPFITKRPLIRWGLPLKYFKPQEMLFHAYSLLNPEGELIIINQGEEEYLIQQELVNKMRTKYEYLTLGETEDCFGVFKNKRFCSKLIKKV